MRMVVGQVVVSSGDLVVLDCGLLGSWRQAAHYAGARAAAQAGGSFSFEGAAGVALGGVPSGTYRIEGAPDATGNRWTYLEVVLQPGAVPVAANRLGVVGVDCARLLFADLGALAHWQHDVSRDGMADVAFWGADAAAVAAEVQAPQLPEGVFGWAGLPEVNARQWVTYLEQVKARGRKMAIDYRPHDHHYLAMALVRASPVEVGMVTVGDTPCLVAATRQGDGMFDVYVILDANGQKVGLRVDFAGQGVSFDGPAPRLPPDPTTAAKAALAEGAKSVVTQKLESAARREMWNRVRGVLPRSLWPLLPDGKRDFQTRAADLGKEAVAGIVAGCLFTGCFALISFVMLGTLVVYILMQVFR